MLLFNTHTKKNLIVIRRKNLVSVHCSSFVDVAYESTDQITHLYKAKLHEIIHCNLKQLLIVKDALAVSSLLKSSLY